MLFDGTPFPDALSKDVFGKHYPTEWVRFTTLDDDFDKTNLQSERGWPAHVSHLKLDVEGCDWPVIKGGKRLIERDLPFMMIELHEGVSSDPNDQVSRYPETIASNAHIMAYLHDLGYEVDVMLWDVSRKFACAAHPSRGGLSA